MRLSRCIVSALLVCLCLSGTALAQELRRLPVEEYLDKMKGGWIGQVAGVGWGGPTEFRSEGKTIPANGVPTRTSRAADRYYWMRNT